MFIERRRLKTACIARHAANILATGDIPEHFKIGTRLGSACPSSAGRDWIMGEAYTIADIATFPWVRNLIGFYEA